jgi:hypothetical protein
MASGFGSKLAEGVRNHNTMTVFVMSERESGLREGGERLVGRRLSMTILSLNC